MSTSLSARVDPGPISSALRTASSMNPAPFIACTSLLNSSERSGSGTSCLLLPADAVGQRTGIRLARVGIVAKRQEDVWRLCLVCAVLPGGAGEFPAGCSGELRCPRRYVPVSSTSKREHRHDGSLHRLVRDPGRPGRIRPVLPRRPHPPFPSPAGAAQLYRRPRRLPGARRRSVLP